MFIKTIFISILVMGLSRPASAESKAEPLLEMVKIGLSGEIEDYKNSNDEWRLIMEARAQTLAFYYWVQTAKFGMNSEKAIEIAFGSWVNEIQNNGGYKRAFIEPEKFKNLEKYRTYAVRSADRRQKIEVRSKQEFDELNKEFLKFLENCVTLYKKRRGTK